MAVGAFLEPLVVVALLIGGAWFNRNTDYGFRDGRAAWESIDGSFKRSDDFCQPSSSQESLLSADSSWTKHSSPLIDDVPTLRRRKIQLFGHKRTVTSPNTLVFKHRFLSRVLQRFPFLVEAWYWALIYWVYQLGRAFTAVTLVEDTVNVARRHALQVIHLEQRLHMFWEAPIQKWFMQHPALMHWINRVYSFIHIPGTIFFLVALYYTTTTRKDRAMSGRVQAHNVTAGPALYEARRRTMAMCNLLAFVVFTLWPCMPPRLLSDPGFDGDGAAEAKGFGFVDTVHSSDGESSVWTTNKFCNQYGRFGVLEL
ncbi:hypothetical protein J3458_001605 [Metarhizium acridum]|uniref:uncharacterized protein n=1 Tax=Metarhizium acridum TaxID=92637 RepID=UPI001C6C554C|nr:hypothetical protein J3458_001605 [Metarhizium acridum]